MSNYKDGRWIGKRKAITKRAYDAKWRKEHPDYFKQWRRVNYSTGSARLNSPTISVSNK
jgi:hypothetical protein